MIEISYYPLWPIIIIYIIIIMIFEVESLTTSLQFGNLHNILSNGYDIGIRIEIIIILLSTFFYHFVSFDSIEIRFILIYVSEYIVSTDTPYYIIYIVIPYYT